MKKVGIFMYRMYRIYDFSDLKDEVFGYLSEFAASIGTSRDDFSTIETDEDGTMSIGVQLDFRVVDEDIEDVDCDARYNFKVLIKGVK